MAAPLPERNGPGVEASILMLAVLIAFGITIVNVCKHFSITT